MGLELLERLCGLHGIAGREEGVRDVVRAELGSLVDEVRVDALGNVIGVRRGHGGRRVMVAAHMDEIGFLVRHVDERGFLRIQPVGGFDASRLPAQRVVVHTHTGRQLPGSIGVAGKPIHLQAAGEVRPVQIDDLFVDAGLTPEQASELVEVGDMVTLERDFRRCGPEGERVMAKALDDRAGLFVLLEALRRLDGPQRVEIVAVATVQEEVGLRGATTAAHTVDPDVGIALDISPAGDFPGAPEEHVGITLGGGVALKVIDQSAVADRRLREELRGIARAHGIAHQLEILPRGGTDAGAMQCTRAGAPVATLSIPVRYAHTVNETCAVEDLEAAVELLARYLEAAG